MNTPFTPLIGHSLGSRNKPALLDGVAVRVVRSRAYPPGPRHHLTVVSNRAKMVGAVIQPLSTLTTRNRRALMPQSSAGPEVWRGERNEQRASDTC